MNLKDIKKHTDWVKMWSAKGSLHFDSHLGEIWTRRKNIAGKAMYRQVMFIYKNGVTDCWATQADRDDLGERLSSLAREDRLYVTNIANDLQSCAERVSIFIDSHYANKISLDEFDEFWNLVYDYYLPHISVKYIVDYVSPEELKVMLPVLEKARLAAEPIYRNIESYVESIAEDIANKTSLTKEMVIVTTKEELRTYFQDKKLPDNASLENRYNGSVMIFDNKDSELFIGEDVKSFEGAVSSSDLNNAIQGQSAYNGKVIGRVRIVLNPSDVKVEFSQGDILVTGMTRPEFVPFLKKSAGFVTDSGGILSHAAISARELQKPCIIGTKIATKVLKDGDLVEVDANKGVVKILKRAGK